MSWNIKSIKTSSLIRIFCNIYIVVSSLIIISLTTAGLLIKEDVALNIYDFSFALDINPAPNKERVKIYFKGVIPSEASKNLKFEMAKGARLYISTKALKSIGRKHNLVAFLSDISIKKFPPELYKGHFGMRKMPQVIVGLEWDILTCTMELMGNESEDLLTILEDFPGEDVDQVFKKVKIVFEETSLLKFWFTKLFSKKALFKKAGQWID